MNDQWHKKFRQIWLEDFEFHQPDGEPPTPICLVAREYNTGETVRLWQDDLLKMAKPPFGTGPDTLHVAYYSSAEASCYLSLGWQVPIRILDLYCEFRCMTNGIRLPCGAGLLGALAVFGLDPMEAAEKEGMRNLAIRGGPYSTGERAALLRYCEDDVDSLHRLLQKMAKHVDLPRALLRGRYMTAAARIERTGVPIDTTVLDPLKRHWCNIQDRLIAEIDRDYGVYDGRTFKAERFEDWLRRVEIPWPRLDSDALDLSDDAFRQAARQYPAVAPLRELRHTLSQLRLNDLAVGKDGRNRCLLSAFRAKTSRNQPSNSRFIFGPSCWERGLIRPEPEGAVAYIDWEQQEFGIGGALSGDGAMMEAYASGDPYLSFAKQAGAVPADATKASHPVERGQFKVCALAVQYGMGSKSLGQSLGIPEYQARVLLRLHQRTYPKYWEWSDSAVAHAMLHGWLRTVFGWRVHVGPDANPRSLANFPVQANGAEMLRLACCLATERRIAVCAPVHDALLIEGPVDQIDAIVDATKSAMAEASRVVLNGFELRSEDKIVRWPDRYMDDRGEKMWSTVMTILGELEESVSA